MTVGKKVQLHIVDSSSGAAQRWARRLASTVDASVRIWDAVPARIPSKGPIVWVLVPDSFASPLAQEDVLDVARRADLRDSVLVVCADDSRLLWDDRATVMLEQEPDHAYTRTLGLLVRMARDQHALHAALQFPVENPNPVMQFSAGGHLMYSNPAATEMMAFAADGHALESQLARWIRESAEDMHVVDVGRQTFGFRVERDAVDGMIRAYGMDLTQSRDAIRKSMAMERESRNKDEFLATMSHELRTPLNAILSCTEALREGAYGDLCPDQLESVGTIRESGKHLLCLINDILDISKIAAGRLDLSMATLGVESVLESVVEMLRGSAEAKRITIEANHESRLSTIKGDPLRIKQILLNLMGNAIKFSPEGTRVGITVRDGRDANVVEFEVWDSGPGVGSEAASAIFKPFVQAEGQYSRNQPGTGLGLAIARDLAILHGGDLRLEAFDQPGAVFIVELPAEEGCIEERFDFRATGAWDLVRAGDELDDSATSEIVRVLIAEDTDSNFQHLHDLLVSMGYTVDRAHNGVEAVDKAHRTSPDLILMDIDMPVMNGLDAIRILRDEPATELLPIIAVTAMAGVADEHACRSAGADGFLAKPYPLRDLMALMQNVERREVRSDYSSTV